MAKLKANLLRAIRKTKFFAVSNWLNKKAVKSKVIPFVNKNYPQLNLTLYDIGAAGGIEQIYKPLLKLNNFQAIGFEPEAEEAEKLKDSTEIKAYPYAIAGNKGVRDLFITRYIHSSSLYRPNPQVHQEYPVSNYFDIINTQQIEVISLDEFVVEKNVAKPDFLKIDAQGGEYEILQGATNVLNNVIGVYFETHLREIYQNEGLFPELHSMLINKGFRLVYTQGNANENFAGEILELNVGYVKANDHLLTETQIVKAVLFCILHSNIEFAAHIIRHSSLSEVKKAQFIKFLSRPLNPQESIDVMLARVKASELGWLKS